MIDALTIVHMIVSVLLVIIVLLQFGRGAEAGFFSDTSSQGVFEGPGRGNILTKMTTLLAIVFLGLALFLANLRGKDRDSSVFDDQAVVPMGTGVLGPKATKNAFGGENIKAKASPAPQKEKKEASSKPTKKKRKAKSKAKKAKKSKASGTEKKK